jgi:Methyltransferase domain
MDVNQFRMIPVQASAAVFDEASYLAANPDVDAAVTAGQLPSGLVHYTLHGFNENRPLRAGVRGVPFVFPFAHGLLPQRRDKILANLDLPKLEGIEIGALTAPLVTPAEGRIRYVDHADTTTLREIYRHHEAVDIEKIVAVDAVWGENTLQDCIGANHKADYVVASHVVEHTPDLITWLAEIRAILRPNGSLRLAIPDRRYTFDYLRVETRVHDVLDAYLRRARTPLPRLIIEHHSLLRHVDIAAAWLGPLNADALQPYNSTALGLDLARDALTTGAYHDVHCWVFTPLTFAALCRELAELDLLGLACGYHIETPHDEAEFYVSMVVNDRKAEVVASWAAMEASLLHSPTYQRVSPPA